MGNDSTTICIKPSKKILSLWISTLPKSSLPLCPFQLSPVLSIVGAKLTAGVVSHGQPPSGSRGWYGPWPPFRGASSGRFQVFACPVSRGFVFAFQLCLSAQLHSTHQTVPQQSLIFETLRAFTSATCPALRQRQSIVFLPRFQFYSSWGSSALNDLLCLWFVYVCLCSLVNYSLYLKCTLCFLKRRLFPAYFLYKSNVQSSLSDVDTRTELLLAMKFGGFVSVDLLLWQPVDEKWVKSLRPIWMTSLSVERFTRQSGGEVSAA